VAAKKKVKKAVAKSKLKSNTKAKNKGIKAKPRVKTTAKAKGLKTPAVHSARPVFSSAALEKVIQPLADRILVVVDRPEEKTAGGLIIPGVASPKPNRGKVLALGSGRRGRRGQVRPLDVRVGDFVIFPEYVGTTVTVEGTELLILREEDVLGIVQ